METATPHRSYHHQLIARIEAEFVSAIHPHGVDHMGRLLREQIDDFNRAVPVSCPNHSVVDRDHPIGAGIVIARGSASEWRVCRQLNQNGVGRGIDEVDGFVGAVSQQIEPDHRIDKTDVKGRDLLTARQCDLAPCGVDLVARCPRDAPGCQHTRRSQNRASQIPFELGAQDTLLLKHVVLPSRLIANRNGLRHPFETGKYQVVTTGKHISDDSFNL
jgi:hypothetical protein